MARRTEEEQMSPAPPRDDGPVDPLDEVPDADAVEQRTSTDDDQELEDVDYTDVLEADPADFADQHRVAPVDDE